MSDPSPEEDDLRSVLSLGADDDGEGWRDAVSDQIAALRANPHILARFAVECGAIAAVGSVRCSTAQFHPTVDRYAGPVFRLTEVSS